MRHTMHILVQPSQTLVQVRKTDGMKFLHLNLLVAWPASEATAVDICGSRQLPLTGRHIMPWGRKPALPLRASPFHRLNVFHYSTARRAESAVHGVQTDQMKHKAPQKGEPLHKSNSNRLIFPFSLSHLIGKSPITILAYWGGVFQQIDFSLFSLIHEWPGSSHACGSCG